MDVNRVTHFFIRKVYGKRPFYDAQLLPVNLIILKTRTNMIIIEPKIFITKLKLIVQQCGYLNTACLLCRFLLAPKNRSFFYFKCYFLICAYSKESKTSNQQVSQRFYLLYQSCVSGMGRISISLQYFKNYIDILKTRIISYSNGRAIYKQKQICKLRFLWIRQYKLNYQQEQLMR